MSTYDEMFAAHIAPGGAGHDAYQAEVYAQWATARARREALGGDASGWTTRVDVAAIADPVPPSLLLRADGRGYGYPGGLHLLYGSRKCGKTMLAARWAADELARGAGVLWLAFEAQQGMRERLALAGVRDYSRLDYRIAGGRPDAGTVAQIAAGARGAGVSLVVIDAMRGLQGAVAPGTSANDGDAVETVYADVLLPFQRAGLAVLVLDHTSKAGGNGSAFGSERKESMADVVMAMEVARPFSREAAGWSQVSVTADRYGYAGEDAPGYLVVTPGQGIAFRGDVPVGPAVVAEDTAALRQRQELYRMRELAVHEAVLRSDDWSANALAEYLAEARSGTVEGIGQRSWRTHIRGMVMAGALRQAFGPRGGKILRPGAGGVPGELTRLLADPEIAARLERYGRDLTAY